MPAAVHARDSPLQHRERTPKKSSKSTRDRDQLALVSPPKRKLEGDGIPLRESKKLRREDSKRATEPAHGDRTADDLSVDVNVRHKAVLAKFEKSRKAAEAAKKKSEAETVAEEEKPEEPLELHGP